MPAEGNLETYRADPPWLLPQRPVNPVHSFFMAAGRQMRESGGMAHLPAERVEWTEPQGAAERFDRRIRLVRPYMHQTAHHPGVRAIRVQSERAFDGGCSCRVVSGKVGDAVAPHPQRIRIVFALLYRLPRQAADLCELGVREAYPSLGTLERAALSYKGCGRGVGRIDPRAHSSAAPPLRARSRQ